MHWLLFIALMAVVLIPIASVVVQEQRWFKKILFYYFPRYLRPVSHQLKPIDQYVNSLPPEQRKRFEWRVYYFLDSTHIEFRNFTPAQLINYNAVRYGIAAVATQMTLFLSDDCFNAFHRIIIYPKPYYSPITKQYHKGETNPAAGFIILTWESFSKGFEDRTDGINLLLHEFAHALWLENKLYTYDIFDPSSFDHYNQTAKMVMKEMDNVPEHFLRRYARVNEEEFFAVAVENFFERPDQFKNALPELYAAMVKLLKQDLINKA
jgi:MtfA peptidase